MRSRITIISLVLALVAGRAAGAQADFTSRYYAIGLSRTAPAFTAFALDSLGHGDVTANPVLAEGGTNIAALFAAKTPGRFVYRVLNADAGAPPVWEVECTEDKLSLRSRFGGGSTLPPFRLAFNQKSRHATLLGRMQPGERRTLKMLRIELGQIVDAQMDAKEFESTSLQSGNRKLLRIESVVHLAGGQKEEETLWTDDAGDVLAAVADVEPGPDLGARARVHVLGATASPAAMR